MEIVVEHSQETDSQTQEELDKDKGRSRASGTLVLESTEDNGVDDDMIK